MKNKKWWELRENCITGICETEEITGQWKLGQPWSREVGSARSDRSNERKEVETGSWGETGMNQRITDECKVAALMRVVTNAMWCLRVRSGELRPSLRKATRDEWAEIWKIGKGYQNKEEGIPHPGNRCSGPIVCRQNRMVENQQDVVEGRARQKEQWVACLKNQKYRELENPALSAWEEELKRERKAGAIREGKEVRRTGIHWHYWYCYSWITFAVRVPSWDLVLKTQLVAGIVYFHSYGLLVSYPPSWNNKLSPLKFQICNMNPRKGLGEV